ncbi:MAG: glutamine-hydrolyzing GMP synthase [Candidatus Thermoplasmatota archaeon]|nr:glutamine-hydrolyzing GMP synthase [Candidatus Thermoplasmatota archaeon]MCL5731686.1 glutamine-hydrolyzing GMP synthase [Candidatus Thermoplasmatota archaeon]
MLDVKKFVDETEALLRRELQGNGIIACSGGTDSTLLAVLCSISVRERVTAVFVDTGLVRASDIENIRKLFSTYSLRGLVLDRSDRFFSALRGVTDPEEKRKIIGRTFIEVFEEIASELGAEYLLQGTIAPDWIESGGGVRDTIKSHHNVGGLPENMKLKLIEPLRDLYKDEVKHISESLGIDAVKQPFPGPGLAVRIIGEVTREKADTLRKVTDIVEEMVESSHGEVGKPWQYFSVLLPFRTTGVHGDKRSYGLTVGIRIFDSIDGMSGTFTKPSWSFLETLSTRITNEVPEINRVVYDITNKPPGTIEWE